MKGLYRVLPPFSPDYSGVCSVLFELGGIVVIHDAGGCTGNVTGYDEPRWYGSSSAIFSSELREIDSVLGDDEKLLRKIEEAANTLNRSFVAILGSPAPMVIGTDYKALGNILSKETGLPVLTFDTNGMNYYDGGASMAFLEIARNFVKPASETFKSSVNIIGATPLDLGCGQHVEDIITILSDSGCRLISCWAMGSSIEDIAHSAKAELNIVVSSSGLEAARYMEQEHGIPYLAGIPVGRISEQHFVNKVHSLIAGSPSLLTDYKPHAGIQKALIIGEQVMSNAVRECLYLDFGITDVTVASFFIMDRALQKQGDVYLQSEDELTSLSADGKYDFIIGDPLYRDLVSVNGKTCFIHQSHAAVSSRLYWDDNFNCIGEAGALWLGEAINNKTKKYINFHNELLDRVG